MKKLPLTKEQKIVALRKAIEKDEEQKGLYEENNTEIFRLQKLEKEAVANELVIIQDEIIRRSQLVYDFSDDMTLDSMREVLSNLEKTNGESK